MNCRHPPRGYDEPGRLLVNQLNLLRECGRRAAFDLIGSYPADLMEIVQAGSNRKDFR